MSKVKTTMEWLLGLLVILGIVGAFFLAYNIGYIAFANEPAGNDKDRVIELVITEGDSILDVADKLEEEEVISSKIAFCLRSKFSKYDGMMKTGTYELNETMGNVDILKIITQME